MGQRKNETREEYLQRRRDIWHKRYFFRTIKPYIPDVLASPNLCADLHFGFSYDAVDILL